MNGITILHLEDSSLDAELIRARLELDGFDADIQRVDGRAGFLAALGSRGFDLILADHSLPDFDGLSALELARRVAPETPFLFVSGQLGEEVAIETLKRGATDYVLKQRLQRLGPAVRRALAEARERADRRRAEAALNEGEARHRLILDSITDYAVITTDTAGVVRSWNTGAFHVFGRTEAEMCGRPVDPLFSADDVAAGIPARERERARLDGRGESERWYARADGSRFWGSGVVVPLTDPSGRLRGFTKVIRDMTGRKHAEDALREADRRKDEFLAMLAHELRNPLAAIQNAVRLEGRDAIPVEVLSQTREVMAHQVRHLARLVDDLLDVSRITRGQIQLRRQPVDLADVARRAVDAVGPAISEHGHALAVDLGDQPLPVFADPTRLEQVLVNLLSNAAKYTDPNGHISLTAARMGDRVVVRVKDDGIGMTPYMIGRAFDLFSQADVSLDRSRGGLGLGLTLVKKLVSLHEGDVSAASAGAGAGSEFQVDLPLHRAPGETAAPVRGKASRASREAGRRILVVDDNVQSAWTLAQLLRTSGHTVATAHDGFAALEEARRQQPEVVLLDIGLPVLDGYQVARQLRREDALAGTLIVAITGYGEEQAVRRSREAGIDSHMVKPVDFDDLLTLLDSKAHQPTPSRDLDLGNH